MSNLPLNVRKEDLVCDAVLCNAKGIRNGPGARVVRRFPVIRSWSGTLEWFVLDDQVTEEIFVRHLCEAAKLVGVGRWRVGNGGQYGRFKVVKFETHEE